MRILMFGGLVLAKKVFQLTKRQKERSLFSGQL
jgi:hypothetical protein